MYLRMINVIIVLLLMNGNCGRYIILTEFGARGHLGSRAPGDKASLYSCLFQCEHDVSCVRAEVTSGNGCILSSHSNMVKEDGGGQVFIKDPISSCTESLESGIHMLRLKGNDMRVASVYCKVNSKGTWIIIQRRQNGLVNFYRDWAAYRSGFGDLQGDFWLGNDVIHLLTKAGDQKLIVEMDDWNDIKYSVEYQTFIVADEADKYRLTIGNFQGTSPPGDAFCTVKDVNGMQFTTYDSDNDKLPTGNCASLFVGAWWFLHCHHANPNGEYNNTAYGKGINWGTWTGLHYSLKRIELKITKK